MTPQPVSRWRALVTRFVAALAILSVATAGSLAYAYWFANDQLTHHTKKAEIGRGVLAPVRSTEPANYLIVGSDSRAFVEDPVAADHFGTQKSEPGNRADVIMIAHVDPNAPGKGFLVSIPRDTWVPIPHHGTQKINAALNYGKGPSTLIKTIQHDFGFKINHYLKLDFLTFTDVVNAIGSVHIFFPAAAYDTYTGLDIKTPGCVALDGLQALAYARSRHYHYKTATGAYKEDETADIGRIQRQQYFIRSLAQEAIKDGARNPLKARRLLEKIVPHLEIDRAMGLQAFLSLVRAFRSVDPGAVQMVTVPTSNAVIYPNGKKTDVQLVQQAQAHPIFALLGSFAPAPKSTASAKIAPAKIHVQVLNGSGVKGIAATAAAALKTDGFASGGAPTDADNHNYQYTQIRYTAGNIAAARVVATYLRGVGLLTLSSTPLGSAVVVVTGHDFVGVGAPGSRAKTPAGSTVTSASPNPGTTPGVTVPASVAGRPAVGCG